MAAILPKQFEIKQKCPDFKWSRFQMAGTIAISKAVAQPFKKPI